MNESPTPDPSQVEGPDPASQDVDWEGPTDAEVAKVAKLFNSLGKAVRAHQLYDENNPVYQRFTVGLKSEFGRLWEWLDRLVIQVEEDIFVWTGEEVYRAESRNDSIAFLFYKDGVRQIVFEPGIEDEELTKLLSVIHRARNLRPESDDLLTILWDEDLEHFRYDYIDVLSEGVSMPEPGGGADRAAIENARRSELAEAGEPEEEAGEEGSESAAGPPPQAVSKEDFNPTLYSLDPKELKQLREEMQAEMDRDLRRSVLSALFDRLEEPENRERQSQILGIFRTLLPNFLSRGELRPAAAVLHELNSVRSAEGMLDEQRMAETEELLEDVSSPETIREMVRSLRDGSIDADTRSLGVFLRFLKPSALATLLWASETEEDTSVKETLREGVRSLAEKHRSTLIELLESDDPLVVAGAARLAGSIGATEVAPRLGGLLEHPLPEVRVAAIDAAVALRASSAASALVTAMKDSNRDVRIQAARALGTLRYKPAAGAFRDVLTGKAIQQADVTEIVAFFESYGELGDEDAVPLLAKMLNGKGLLGRRELAEIRAGAALALGRIGTAEANRALEEARSQDEPVVRSAVGRALRGADGGARR